MFGSFHINIAEEDTICLAQSLNLMSVSIYKIIGTQDRVFLDLEYNNIIRNLKFELIKRKLSSVRDINNLYKQIMDEIGEFTLSNNEREEVLNQLEKEKRRVLWKNVAGIWVEDSLFGTLPISLVQSGISAYFNYRELKSEIEELEEELWELEKNMVARMSRLWTKWLQLCFNISFVYNFEGKGLRIISEDIIREYLKAEQEQNLKRSISCFQKLEQSDVFNQSYPPFWLSYATKADKAGDAKTRDQCLTRFFETHRNILTKDPIYSKACMLQIQSLYQQDLQLKDDKIRQEIETLTRTAEKHIEDTDGLGRIFLSTIYQELGKPEDARRGLEVNIAKSMDIELSQRALTNLQNKKSILTGFYQLLDSLIAKDADAKEMSLEQLKQLADKGKHLAMNIIGKKYYYGRGVRKNYKKAREWYEKAAEKGNADAMFSLGLMYENAKGVSRDYGKAREWYEKAAERGNADAMFSLGLMYNKAEGVPKDYEKAIYWYEKAVEKGQDDAMFCLGWLYYYGEGVPVDYAKAKVLFEKAVRRGNADAMLWLGYMYENSQGVPEDRVLAYAYYILSDKKEIIYCEYDTRKAKICMDNLYEMLTKEEIREAEEIADSWKEGLLLKRLK